ncbi:murein hydrolase activator EnvC family protein [Geminicoccus roseus]|uniref:murein hydrolase activator EnvC family protein n=1 Tax=Geminicoccus roseus TaxID=404900 RepID=UPI00146FA448|nr:peptidoglycan DD-metalloendopeptidase family protein [Geminicoccus roseus]
MAASAATLSPEVAAGPQAAPDSADLEAVAQRMRRLHLATIGLDAADGHARMAMDRMTALEDAAAAARDVQAAQVRQVRLAAAGGVAAVMAALRAEADPRARAARRAALSVRRFAWTATERDWRGAQASVAQLAATRFRNELLVRDLDERALQVARQRDAVDDLPLAAVAMAARNRPSMQDSFAVQLADIPFDQVPVGLGEPQLTSAALRSQRGMVMGPMPMPSRGQGLPWPPLGDVAAQGSNEGGMDQLDGSLTAWSGLLASIPATGDALDLDRMTDRGLVLQAPAGGAIAAPDAGTVVFAGSFRSYGQILIIDHGNDYHTLMAGFSHLDVAEGAHVQAGERIGGMDPGSSVPGRLYVEVRRRGVPVDPMPWLAAREDKVRG